MKTLRSTRFRDVLLDAKRVLRTILPTNLPLRNLDSLAAEWLTPKLNFSFLSCNEHRAEIFALFKKLTFQKYCQGILTNISRIFRGRIIPRNENLSLPVKEALNCYLKTIHKDKRKEILNIPDPIKLSVRHTSQTKQTIVEPQCSNPQEVGGR